MIHLPRHLTITSEVEQEFLTYFMFTDKRI